MLKHLCDQTTSHSSQYSSSSDEEADAVDAVLRDTLDQERSSASERASLILSMSCVSPMLASPALSHSSARRGAASSATESDRASARSSSSCSAIAASCTSCQHAR